MKYLACFGSMLAGAGVAVACGGTPNRAKMNANPQTHAPIILASTSARAADTTAPTPAKAAANRAAWQTLATGGVMRIHALSDGVYLTNGFNIGEQKAEGLTWRPELERGLPRGDHSMYSTPTLLNLHGSFAQRALATSTRASGAPATFGPEETRYYWAKGKWQMTRPEPTGFANLESYATSGMTEEVLAEFPIGTERVRLMATYLNGTSDGLDTALTDRNIVYCTQHPARYVGMNGTLPAAVRAALPAIPAGYCVVGFRAYEGAGYMLVLHGDRGVRVDVVDQLKSKSYRAEQATKRVEISSYPDVAIRAFGEFSVVGIFASHDINGTPPPASTHIVNFEVKDGVQRDLPVQQSAEPEDETAAAAAARVQDLLAAKATRKELSARVEGRTWRTTPYRKLPNFYVSNGGLYDLQGKYVPIQLDAAGTSWLTQSDGTPYGKDELAQRNAKLEVQDAYELGDVLFVSLSIPIESSYGSAEGLLAALKRAPGAAALAVNGKRGEMSERAVPKITLRVVNGSFNLSGPLRCANENAIVPVRIVPVAREADALRELAAAQVGSDVCTLEVVRSGGQSYLYQSGESGDQLTVSAGVQLKASQTAYCLPTTGDIRYSISPGKSQLLSTKP